MNVNWAIDWLAFNANHTYDLNHQAIAYKPELWSWTECKGSFGYDRAVETSDKVRVMWSTTRQDMGTFVSYPGKALSSYRDRGITAVQIIESHKDNGDTCKRLDLALDAYNSGLDITELFRHMKQDKAETNVKKYSLITGNQGDTLYIGSRESEQFIRVYDKAKESGDFTSDRIRIEIELKGSRAVQMAAQVVKLAEGQAAQRTQSLINSIIVFNVKEWKAVMGEQSVGIAKAKDEQADTEKWLLQSVAPAMAKYIKATEKRDTLDKFNRIVIALADLDKSVN